MLDEQIQSVRLELMVRERMAGSEVLLQEFQRSPHLAQWNFMVLPQRFKDMNFHQVYERKNGPRRLREVDHWFEEAVTGISWIMTSEDPRADGRRRDSEIPNRLRKSIGRELPRITSRLNDRSSTPIHSVWQSTILQRLPPQRE